MKKCKKCKKKKQLPAFSKSAMHKGGFRHVCKTCDAKRSAFTYYRVGKKNRKRDPQQVRDTIAKMRKLYPEKQKARRWVRERIASGKILVPEKCFDCGKKPMPLKDGRRGLMADHYKGYEKKNWLIVQFICRPCDGKRRRKY